LGRGSGRARKDAAVACISGAGGGWEGGSGEVVAGGARQTAAGAKEMGLDRKTKKGREMAR
jgi:hypothetical protein